MRGCDLSFNNFVLNISKTTTTINFLQNESLQPHTMPSYKLLCLENPLLDIQAEG